MSQLAWLTKNSIPATRQERSISLPNDEKWQADFLGAIYLLTQEENWEQDGTLTPAEMAEEWLRVFLEFEEFMTVIVPIGSILMHSTDTPPTGWLLCDGAAISRTIYANLFAVIGTFYGIGNGSTTFNLPDLRGYFPVAKKSGDSDFPSLGLRAGSKRVFLLTDEMPSHTHVQDAHTHVQNSHTHVQDAHTHVQNPHSHVMDLVQTAPTGGTQRVVTIPGSANVSTQNTTPTNQSTTPTNQSTTPTNQSTTPTNQNTGGGQSHENLPPYFVLNFIIKT